jgi:hypothetical protein
MKLLIDGWGVVRNWEDTLGGASRVEFDGVTRTCTPPGSSSRRLLVSILVALVAASVFAGRCAAGTAGGETPGNALRCITFYQHDTDEGTFWTPQPMDQFRLDQLWLRVGQPIAGMFLTNDVAAVSTRLKQPRVTVFALDITQGDAQFFREARHQWPGMYPTLIPVPWQELPTVFANRQITADTTNLPAGVYRLRVAAADGAAPSPIGAGLFGDGFVVIADSPHSLDVLTPQNRAVFFRGESIPVTLLVRSRDRLPAGKATFDLATGTSGAPRRTLMAVPEVLRTSRRIPLALQTKDLGPGLYTLTVAYAGLKMSYPLEIVEPAGPSVIAISENQIPGSPFGATLMGSPFGGKPVDSLAHGLAAPYADLQITTFRNELGQGYARQFNQRLADILASENAGPAAERIGTYDLRQLWMDGMTRLRMGYWQGVQGRGLSFSKANTLPGTEDAVRQSLAGVARDYREFANFFGPQVDVDCGAVAASGQLAWAQIPDTLTTPFRERMAAAQQAAAGGPPTPEWYRGVWARTDAKDKAALALLDPTLALTANREYHHGDVGKGQYAPALYRGLDVHNVEAWGDAIDNILFPDAWANLGAAARRASGRTDQPLWIETQMFHADVSSYLQNRWWGVLANGADGVGYAANVFGLRQYSGIEPHQPNFRRQTAAAMARMVRTIGPALRQMDRERRVAILFSKTEVGNESFRYNVHSKECYPPFVTFFALVMAGYQPDYIFEEQILNGELDRYPLLYLTWQQKAMAPAIKARVDAFVARGGKLAIDAASNASLYPGARVVEVNPQGYKGPGGFGGPEDWAWIDQNVPRLRAALDPLLPPLPGRVQHPRCVTYWLTRGDTRYCLVINEGYEPLETLLKLETPMGGYDMLTGDRIEPTSGVPVDLRNLAARLYAFTPRALDGLSVRATPSVRAGEPVGIVTKMNAFAPGTIRILDPQGKTRWERWVPVGTGSEPVVWDTAATDIPGSYTVQVTELLSGQTAAFEIALRKPGKTAAWLGSRVPDELDRRTLGNLWSRKGTRWSIVLTAAPPDRVKLADKLAAALRRRGLTVDKWENPETIPMPVGYLFTPAQQQARDRVFAGEAFGARHYLHGHDGDKTAPDAETWEPRSGRAIYRNVIFLEDAAPPGIRVGVREFSGDHDAVHLAAPSPEAMEQLIAEALSLKPSDTRIGPEVGREAFARGYLLGGRTEKVPAMKPIAARTGKMPITWGEQIGRPVMQLYVSPNGQHILAKQHGVRTVLGRFKPDGTVVSVETPPVVGDTGDDAVRGIDDAGAFISATAAPSTELASPNGKYRWKPDDGSPRSQHIGPRTAVMLDAGGGKLWEKKGWWVFNSVWSRDGEYLAVIRHYQNVDRHGVWPDPSNRSTVSFVRAADGEVIAEGSPSTWPDRIQITADNRFVIALPAYMAEYYWLLTAGGGLTQVKASEHWLYTATLDTAGKQLVTLDMAGVLRRHQPTGEVIWESVALQRPWGAELGLLAPCGDDFLLGSTTGRLYLLAGRDGAIQWQREGVLNQSTKRSTTK